VQSLPFFAVGLSSLACGRWSDWLISRGHLPSRVRKTFMVGGLSFSMLLLPSGLVQSRELALGFLIAACICFGACSSHIWLITQRLAGPLAAGRWTGIQNGIGNLAGIVAPIVTGSIVKSTGKFYPGVRGGDGDSLHRRRLLPVHRARDRSCEVAICIAGGDLVSVAAAGPATGEVEL
jgi:hypothetical protein